jgi:hypothetical protein
MLQPNLTKPNLVPHVDIVKDVVQDRHQQVRDVHVGQESVGYCPQRAIPWNSNSYKFKFV